MGRAGGAAVVQILSAVERVDEVTGELFYDIDVNIKSFADNNQVRAVRVSEAVAHGGLWAQPSHRGGVKRAVRRRAN